jgi:hypothetical protein
VRDAVDTFNAIQDVGSAVMEEFRDSEGSDQFISAFTGLSRNAMVLGLKGGSNKYTRKGILEHVLFGKAARASGMQAEVWLDRGRSMKVDAMDSARKIIYELKPFSNSGMRKGLSQLKRYLMYLRKKDPRWTGQLVFY